MIPGPVWASMGTACSRVPQSRLGCVPPPPTAGALTGTGEARCIPRGHQRDVDGTRDPGAALRRREPRSVPVSAQIPSRPPPWATPPHGLPTCAEKSHVARKNHFRNRLHDSNRPCLSGLNRSRGTAPLLTRLPRRGRLRSVAPRCCPAQRLES